MNLKQKADFVSGYDYWHLEEAEELGLPENYDYGWSSRAS